MSRNVGFLINPLSHTVSKRGSALARIGAGQDGVLIRELTDFTELGQHLEAFATADIGALFIEGGDGTAMAVLSEVLSGRSALSAEVPIALLPGGNTNLAAKVIGVRHPRRGGVTRLMAALEDGTLARHVAPLSLLKITLVAGASPLFGFFLSTGVLPNAIRYCRRALHERGAAGSLAVGLTVARLILQPRNGSSNDVIHPTDLAVETPMFQASGEHLFTLATTLPHLSLGIDPFWGREDAVIRFTHGTWPGKAIARSFLSVLLRRYNAARLSQRGFRSYNLPKAELTYRGDLVLDGEFLIPPPSGKIALAATAPVRFIR